MSNKFVLSYSGGKDCILALYRKIEQGDVPVALLTTVKKYSEETWTHGLTFDLLEQVSKSLELPIIYAQCDVSEYEDVFEEKLKEAKKMGATSVVYGDIDIAGIPFLVVQLPEFKSDAFLEYFVIFSDVNILLI